MKKLLLLTSLFLAFACSKDDGDDNSSDSQMFLAKYNNTSWFFQEEDYGDEYLFISSNSPEIRYAEINGGENYCEQWKFGTNVIEGETIEVILISEEEERLVFDVDYDGDGTIRYIMEVNGNQMTFTVVEEVDTKTYNKTNITYSSLCN